MKTIRITARDPRGSSAQPARRPITEVMSKPVVCVTASKRLGDALAILVRSGLRHLAVVDESDTCVGVLSDRTIAAAWATDPTALSCQRVSAVLDPRPATVGLDAAVVDAARLMCDAGVGAVVVVDARGAAVGMVTRSDLVALLAR